jgi:DNA (cytosine-5)-methyltransferase 1
MKLKEKVLIDEFDGKKFQIRLIDKDETNKKKAVITHYLHNLDNGLSGHYKTEAIKFLKEYLEIQKVENNLIMVEENALQTLLFEVNDVPFPTPKNYNFKFIVLFAGIGGFRIAMQNLGGKCVFTSEWDKEAQRTYRANFGEVPFGDITKEYTKKFIPDGFDVLGVSLSVRAFRSNLFARSSQKGFPLQSLTQKAA